MTVIYIRPGNSKGYLRVGVESDKKYDFTVSESEYSACGSPLTGDNLTRDSFDLLYSADMRYKARLKALRILSFGDNSELMLKRKLLAAGIKRDIIDGVVAEAVSLGYINAERQIKKLIINEVSYNLSGPRKIIPKLINKGYSKSDIEAAISQLVDTGEVDFEAAKARLIESKLPENADEEQIKKLLYKNGYYVC